MNEKPQEQARIPAALERLAEATHSCLALARELQNRLQPVMRQEAPLSECENTPALPSLPTVETRIRNAIDVVEEARDVIQDALRRLDL